jgi:hypothetical protein
MLRWMRECNAPASVPVLQVRANGKLPAEQAVHWVIPGDSIALLDTSDSRPDGSMPSRLKHRLLASSHWSR